MKLKKIKEKLYVKEETREQRQYRHIILVAMVVILFLAAFISVMIKKVEQTVMQGCFDNLSIASEGLARDLRSTATEDQLVLSAIANVIASEDDLSNERLTQLLNCYDVTASYMSYIELLRPDNTMLDSDGTVRDVSGKLDFATEAKKGICVSGIVESTKDAGDKVIRNIVPVNKDGKAIYVLYGTVLLGDFAKQYKVDIYNGNAYIFVIDGDTGDFILDTWHKSLGNISDFTDRKLLSGYSWEKAIADMNQGKSGRLSFISNTLKETVCIYYAPSEINNWNVMVMIPQKVAFLENQTIRYYLYFMTAVIGIVIVGYMIFVSVTMYKSYKKVKKLGLEDQNTGLMNRNAYDKYMADNVEKIFPIISCVYIDVNGLHEINNEYGHTVGDQLLRQVADTLRQNFPNGLLYRIGGDEYVIFCELYKYDIIQQKMDTASKELKELGHSISYGITSLENETGLDRITKLSDERMLQHKREYYAEHERRKGGW